MFLIGGGRKAWANDYLFVKVQCYDSNGSLIRIYDENNPSVGIKGGAFYSYEVYVPWYHNGIQDYRKLGNVGGGIYDWYYGRMYDTGSTSKFIIKNITSPRESKGFHYIGSSVVEVPRTSDWTEVFLSYEYGHNSKGSGYDQTDTQHRRYTCCSHHPSQNRSYGSWQNHSWTTTKDWYVYNDTTLHQDQKCSVCGRTRTNSKPRHTHNSNGVGYNINDTQHQKYTYCNGHGSDTTQNRQYGSWENHAWVHENNTTDKCSSCGKTRTRTYWVNISMLDPDNIEHTAASTGIGYFRVSNDGINWSDLYYDQPDTLSYIGYAEYGSKIYIQYVKSATPTLEFKAIKATYNCLLSYLTSTGDLEKHQLTGGSDLTKVGNNTWVYTVTNDTVNGMTSGQCIHIYMDYKHTTLTLNTNGGSINGSTGAQALSPKLQYSTVQWNNLSTKKPSRTGYTFIGWYDQASGGTKVYNADGTCVKGTKYFDSNGNSLMTSDVTLYAQWSINTYHIYYTLYGSSASVKRTYTITDNAFTLPKPSLNGYTFKGWIGGIDKKDPLRDTNSKIYVAPTAGITIPKGTYGDYFFRAVFEKNHSSIDGSRTDDVYVAHSEVKEQQY